MTTCIKTGCGLTFDDGRFYWGDLHQQGETLLFNSVVRNGEALEQDATRYEGCACVHLPSTSDYFERRGLFVFPRGAATFNFLLITHLGGL